MRTLIEIILFRLRVIKGREINRDKGILIEHGTNKLFKVTYELPCGYKINKYETL